MDDTTVRWAFVPGFEDRYEVSDSGFVRSVKSGRTLSGYLSNGYLRVVLSLSGKQKHFSVHRLVLTVFVAAPEDWQEGCHRDADRTNNRVSNLYWGSRMENVADRFAQNGGYFKVGTIRNMCRLGHPTAVRIVKNKPKKYCPTCRSEYSRAYYARQKAALGHIGGYGVESVKPSNF